MVPEIDFHFHNWNIDQGSWFSGRHRYSRHIPLWTIYPDWGWGTDDSEQALSYVKRFGPVTVSNGHIHQIRQKVEGKVSFHTAMSAAFPQPAPGTAPSAGPMKVPADQLQQVLGITDVNYVVSGRSLAVVDSPLGA